LAIKKERKREGGERKREILSHKIAGKIKGGLIIRNLCDSRIFLYTTIYIANIAKQLSVAPLFKKVVEPFCNDGT
jgi:hypothetical protein